MWTSGTKGGTGSISVRAGSYTYSDTSTKTGLVHSVSSHTYAATWAVSGAGATGGYGHCGS